MSVIFQFVYIFRNSSLKKRNESDVFKIHSQKKLDSYIHHVVSNSIPPTAQVGGAVIKTPRLPLPPIQLPNTAPPIITMPSKKIVPHINKEPIDADKNEVDNGHHGHVHEDSVDIEVDSSPLQSDSTVSVGSNEVKETDHHDNNCNNSADVTNDTAPSANTGSSLSAVKTTEDVSISPPEANAYEQKVKALKSPVVTKPLKKPLQHKKKVLSSALSSPLPDSSHKNDHSTAESLHTDKDDKLLPALKGKDPKLSSNFDVVTSLTGQKR